MTKRINFELLNNKFDFIESSNWKNYCCLSGAAFLIKLYQQFFTSVFKKLKLKFVFIFFPDSKQTRSNEYR